MSPYKKTTKVNDIERPIASSIFGRDILGINPNIAAINKTDIDVQDAQSNIDFMRKIK